MNDLFCTNCETDTPHLVVETEDGYTSRFCHVCGYHTMIATTPEAKARDAALVEYIFDSPEAFPADLPDPALDTPERVKADLAQHGPEFTGDYPPFRFSGRSLPF